MANCGLVLEGGAMRGMFTCGVIDVFMENGIDFAATVGVSAGATFGCNIKSKQIGRPIRYNKNYGRDKRYCSLRSLIKTGDLYGAKFCYDTLPNELDLLDYKTYRENPMKFFAVATDVLTGKPVYRELKTCDENDLTWMRASASMPLASRIVEVDGYKLLDGGISDSIPLEFMQTQGYQKNVVVRTRCRDFIRKPNSAMPLIKIAYRKYPNFVNAMQTRHIMYNNEVAFIAQQEAAGNTFVIAPDVELNIPHVEKNPDELERVYQIGRRVATERLEGLREFLLG